MDNSLTSSTSLILDSALMDKIKQIKFCILGCGGVGSNFAEILVRTGAKNISLVDDDIVEVKNLNRTPFVLSHAGRLKVEVLEERLRSINKEIKIISKKEKYSTHLEINSFSNKDIKQSFQEIRDLVVQSDVVIIAFDNHESRIDCWKLCSDHKIRALSIGVGIESQASSYECLWDFDYNKIDKPKHQGYGLSNGSYGSIVMEACASGFNLMLYNLQHPDKPKNKIYRNYRNFIEEVVE